MKSIHSHDCLNCGTPLTGPFCVQCGQSASTHRYSVKSFLSHDLLHSLWHVDKNIFRTLWNIMVRPGTTALRNIAGQRARYFPVLTLLLLLAGTFLYVLHNEIIRTDIGVFVIGELDITEFVLHYQKWILLSTIPLLSVGSWIVFRRLRFNYTEHLIIFSHLFAGVLAWGCLTSLLPNNIPNWLDWTLNIIWGGYWLLILWQAFRKPYRTPAGWAWRVVAGVVLTSVTVVLILIVIVLFQKKSVGLDL